MKRIFVLCLCLLMALPAAAQAEGFLKCTINGEAVEFAHASAVKGMTGTSHTFESDEYTLSILFDKKMAAGETKSPNGLTSIELISHNEATAGYYFIKKSTSVDVDSSVTLDKAEDGLLAGTFTAVVPSADRYVGDLRPGMLETLPLEDGEFSIQF